LWSIANSTFALVSLADLDGLRFERLRAFDSELPPGFTEIHRSLEERLWHFEAWVSDVRKVPEPRFLADRRFVLALIQLIQQQLPVLAKSTYFVYLDEYENLSRYQQELINTWLKHSETPLIF